VQCYGFEPEPRNFSYLKQNIEENCPHGNVLLEKLALFDCKDILEFELSPVNFGDHRVRTSGVNGVYQEGARMTISVAADRLDSVMQVHALKQPIAVKIDTQGAEAKIFSGGQKVLSGASLIALEFWPYGMRRVGGDVEAWIEFLGSNFREGSIAEGDTDTPPRWRPIPAIVRELHELWAESPASVGRRYVDVIVRR
jgi:FkbM family methyltransferase